MEDFSYLKVGDKIGMYNCQYGSVNAFIKTVMRRTPTMVIVFQETTGNGCERKFRVFGGCEIGANKFGIFRLCSIAEAEKIISRNESAARKQQISRVRREFKSGCDLASELRKMADDIDKEAAAEESAS